MYNFDPAINYGPNDAGASAISIFLVVMAVSLSLFLIFLAYEFVANLANKREEDVVDKD